MKDSRIQFYGNINVDSDFFKNQIQNKFTHVVFAFGAAQAKSVVGTITGNSLFKCSDFVNWINGNPRSGDSMERLETALLESSTLNIFGVGNVALDISRLVLSASVGSVAGNSQNHYQFGDAPKKRVSILRQNSIKTVNIYGRRGPANISFTPKELRELLGLIEREERISFNTNFELIQRELPNGDARVKKMLQMILCFAEAAGKGACSDLSFNLHFNTQPLSVLSASSAELPNQRIMSIGAIGYEMENSSLEAFAQFIRSTNGGTRKGSTLRVNAAGRIYDANDKMVVVHCLLFI